MIRREIEEHANVGAEFLNELKLKTAQLDDSHRVVGHTVDAGNQRSADVASKNCRKRCRPQDMFDQRSGGSFSVRASDADKLALAKPVSEFDLAPNADAVGVCGLQQRTVRGHPPTGN